MTKGRNVEQTDRQCAAAWHSTAFRAPTDIHAALERKALVMRDHKRKRRLTRLARAGTGASLLMGVRSTLCTEVQRSGTASPRCCAP